MAAATLTIDLEARLARLEQDLGKATRLVERDAKKMDRAFAAASTSLKSLVGGLAAGASVTFLTQLARNTIDGIDALNDLSDATGSSVENLSALEDIAARTGTTMDTVGDALIKLNKTLGDAKPGTDAADALKVLGLSAKELKTLDPAEALQRTAIALGNFADDGNKARLTQELFGKSLKDVAPLLKNLAETSELNALRTTEQAKAAEKFNNEILKIQKSAVDLARDLAGPLVDSINKTIEAFSQGGKDKGFIEKLEDDLRSRLTFEDLTKRIANLQTQLSIEPKGTGIYAAIEREIAEKTKLLQATEKGAAAAFRPSQNYGDAFKPSAPVIGGGDKTKPATLRSLDPFIDPATADALSALQSTDVAKIAKLNATLDELFRIRGSGEGGGPELDAAVESLRNELQKLDPAAVAAAESAKRLQDILDQTPTAKFEEALKDIELLNKAFDEGKLQAEQWAEAIRLSTAKIGGDAAIEEIEKLSAFAEQASRNIQDALGDTLESALQGSFDSIGDLWKNLLIKMAAQAVASDLNNALFGGLGGGTGTGAGLVGALFGLSGARADGGPVSAGGAYLVGERGPEIFTPRSAGMVLPNGVGMGGVNVNIVQHIGQGVSRGEVYAAAMQAKDAAKAEIMQTLYRTGRGAYA
jgi:hypothetical protein